MQMHRIRLLGIHRSPGADLPCTRYWIGPSLSSLRLPFLSNVSYVYGHTRYQVHRGYLVAALKNASTLRILSNGIRKCIVAVSTKYVSSHWVYFLFYFVLLEGLYLLPIVVSLHALYSIPTGAVFRKWRMEANIMQWGKEPRIYQRQTRHTPVTCHLPCTYMSSGTRLKLDKLPR